MLLLLLEKLSLNRNEKLSCIQRINHGGHTGGVRWEGHRSNLDLILERHRLPVVFYFCALKEKTFPNGSEEGPISAAFPLTSGYH